MGGEIPDSWDGESFASSLGGEDTGLDFLVISQGAWSCQRSIRWDKWLLMRTYHTGLKAFLEYMLFDLENDPHETTNLARLRETGRGHHADQLEKFVGAALYRAINT